MKKLFFILLCSFLCFMVMPLTFVGADPTDEMQILNSLDIQEVTGVSVLKCVALDSIGPNLDKNFNMSNLITINTVEWPEEIRPDNSRNSVLKEPFSDKAV